MLVRAAEIRESEQQQIFDTLDEIHGRLAPLEAIGSMRKRLAEIPDRNEMSVLAERLDETVAKLAANDSAIATLTSAVESIVDKLAKPFAQLDGRLDGVAGRFEGVAGRMDGLEDKLSSIHRRLDELELHLDKQDTKIEALPREINANMRDRMDAIDQTLTGKLTDTQQNVQHKVDAMSAALDETRESLSATKAELTGKITAGTEEIQGAIAETTDVLHGKLAETHAVAVDSTRFDTLAQRIDQLSAAMDSVTNRLDGVESDLTGKIGDVTSSIRGELSAVRDTVNSRPDATELDSLVRRANSESEQRNAGQLDEAMATFAELILGGGSSSMSGTASLPKQARRNAPNRTKARTNGQAPKEPEEESV